MSKIENKKLTLKKSGGEVTYLEWLKSCLESVPIGSAAPIAEIRSRLKILDKLEVNPDTDFSPEEIKVMKRCVLGTTWVTIDKAVDEFVAYFEELK